VIEPDAVAVHPNDEVATAMRELTAGNEAVVECGTERFEIRISTTIPRGHKLALEDLRAGAHVHKYGEVIGRLTDDVPAGGHVHVHNLRSLRTGGRRSDAR